MSNRNKNRLLDHRTEKKKKKKIPFATSKRRHKTLVLFISSLDFLYIEQIAIENKHKSCALYVGEIAF